MANVVIESERRVPVAGEFDVAVVGGGIAGVAAAVAAVRNGARTCLIEKQSALGGLSTLGNVVMFLPLCDGRGNQVIAGLGDELMRLGVRDGAAEIPACWRDGGSREERLKTRFEVLYHPASYMLELESLVIEAGVELFYDTRFCDVVMKGDRIDALLLENKSGRLALRCGAVVDASGDADVCARAGEDTVSHRTNVAGGWFHYARGREVNLNPMTRPFTNDPNTIPEGVQGYAGHDGRDVTAQILESRQMIRDRLAVLRSESPGEAIYPVFIPTISTFRMTRRLKGQMELGIEDGLRPMEDVVGRTGDWRIKGPVHNIPLRCLCGVRSANIVTAGRCISAKGRAWDMIREIAVCAVTGEAAGTAAAVAMRDHEGCVRDVNLAVLQQRLRDQGVLLGNDE